MAGLPASCAVFRVSQTVRGGMDAQCAVIGGHPSASVRLSGGIA
ncbi:hypothetical protein [Paenibacillus xylaniclasticus]|nr:MULTISPECIES: hypothetical protein [Paenibacillus]